MSQTMTQDHNFCPTLRDLAAEIGQVQIRWCFLENEMRRQLEEAGLQEKLTRGPVISHWRQHVRRLAEQADDDRYIDHLAGIERVASVRNLLAHGIDTVSADWSQPGSAFVVCIGADGSSHRFTLAVIQNLAQEIDNVRHAMRNVLFPQT